MLTQTDTPDLVHPEMRVWIATMPRTAVSQMLEATKLRRSDPDFETPPAGDVQLCALLEWALTRPQPYPAPTDERLPALALLLTAEANTPASYGYLARVAGLPKQEPTRYPFAGMEAASQFWLAGYHAADVAKVAQQLEDLKYLTQPNHDQVLGRPGNRLRDEFAYRELAAHAYRQDPHVEQVPVLRIEVGGQGTFTAALSLRLQHDTLRAFLYDSGVIGDAPDDEVELGAITYHLWTPKQLEELAEWPA